MSLGLTSQGHARIVFQGVTCMLHPQLGVTSSLAEHAFCHILQVLSKDTNQYQLQF